MPDDFVPEDYFTHCYGIDHRDDPQRVVLKTSAWQANFIRALPLHHTQKEEETTSEYSIFSYYICPDSYDFKQAILSYMAEVEVLAPASLRDEMANTTKMMAAKYQ